ncbi:hypothetical protein SADUNF_Sadunf10G0076300 [Salix dunnii]|uniref:Uncharacterized protein n=1 Tax=Salix dunnii TaxID=1413687 RepID=A0A835MY83_9ROSI|nr:hypothetical protein SADUNF_Sadunf10G0076300 [Salix dunnii]
MKNNNKNAHSKKKKNPPLPFGPSKNNNSSIIIKVVGMEEEPAKRMTQSKLFYTNNGEKRPAALQSSLVNGKIHHQAGTSLMIPAENPGDLSFNPNLKRSLTPQILAGCGFSGHIPDELGNLAELFI